MAYVKGQPFKPQFHDPATGVLMASGTIEFYVSGTSTPTAFYTDDIGTGGGNSLTLDSGGMPPTDIYYDTSVSYKLVLKDALTSTIHTLDPYVVSNQDQVATNTANIAINTSNISTNTANTALKLPLAGGTVTGQIKGITPVDDEDLVRKGYSDTNRIGARVELGHSTTQNVPANSVIYPAWDSEVRDEAGSHSDTVNNSRITVTAEYNRIRFHCEMSANYAVAPTGGSPFITYGIAKNNGASLHNVTMSFNNTNRLSWNLDTLWLDCVATDYYKIFFKNQDTTQAATLAAHSKFYAELMKV